MKLFPLPDWLAFMPDGPDKNKAINRFYLRLAALYATEEGRHQLLADMLDVNYATFRSQVNSKVLASKRTRSGIRRLLGPAFVPPYFPKSFHPR